MKKITTIILSILACTACSVSGAAILHAQKTVRANASEPVPATHLLLPDSYEEYLHLTAPTDVAVTENYTAIADGNVIYVYDRADGVYREYVHDLNVDPLKNNVTKLQFDEAGDLYFLDATYLYVLETDTLDEADPTVRNTKFPCSTFYLHGNMLYYTDTKPSNTQLYALDLAAYDIDGTYARTLTTGELSGKPTITVYNGELYYTSGNNVRRLNLETEKYSTVAVFDNFPAIFSIRIVNGVFCCTSANNPKNFYAYDLADLMDVFAADDSNITPLHKTAGAFSALTAFGNAVYAVDGNSIREYDAVENEFTNYEISNRSSSKHRIDGGTETYLAGNLLLIADSGNQRISVLDTLTGEFGEPIANTLSTSYLVSDGKSVLVANERNAVLYSLEASSYGAKLKEFDDFNGKIIGAASVYGKYYLASNNYCHYVIGQDEQTGWTLTEVQRQPKQMATLLTADAYGYLYLVSGGKIYRYTEAEFLSDDSDGNQLEEYDELSALTKKISVDYDGNIYALIDGGLHKQVGS